MTTTRYNFEITIEWPITVELPVHAGVASTTSKGTLDVPNHLSPEQVHEQVFADTVAKAKASHDNGGNADQATTKRWVLTPLET